MRTSVAIRSDGKHSFVSRSVESGSFISSRSKTGSAWHHQPGGFMPEFWHPSPSMRPRSGLSVFTPVSRLPDARERPGAVREGLAVEGHRRTGHGDPGDEGGEDADCQDRSDHRAVEPDHLQGTESFDSGGRVTLHDDASNRPMSKYKNWTG